MVWMKPKLWSREFHVLVSQPPNVSQVAGGRSEMVYSTSSPRWSKAISTTSFNYIDCCRVRYDGSVPTVSNEWGAPTSAGTANVCNTTGARENVSISLLSSAPFHILWQRSAMFRPLASRATKMIVGQVLWLDLLLNMELESREILHLCLTAIRLFLRGYWAFPEQSPI